MLKGPLIVGISCAFQVNGGRSKRPTGPAFYAAIGSRLVGAMPSVATQVGQESYKGYRRLCDQLQIESELVTTAAKALVWQGHSIGGDREIGGYNGDPDYQVAEDTIVAWPSAVVIANTNPSKARRWIAKRKGKFTAIDLFHGWIRYYPKTSLECARDADFVSLTQYEASLIGAHEATGSENHVLTAVKCGADGVMIESANGEEILPAPRVSVVRCDIGAGDLLIGALGSAVYGAPLHERPQAAARAYQRILPALEVLLSSPTPDDFVSAIAADFLCCPRSH